MAHSLSFSVCILVKGDFVFKYYEQEQETETPGIPDTPYISQNVTLTGSHGNLGDWPHWCLGNLTKCPNGIGLDIWIKFTGISEESSELIVFSNGGHSLYSNGIYLLQRYGSEYELGVAMGPLVWSVRFRVAPMMWLNINAVWSKSEGLFVLVDGRAYGDDQPHQRDFEEWMFETFMDVVIGVDPDGSPHIHESRFEIEKISMFNWQAPVVPPDDGK